MNTVFFFHLFRSFFNHNCKFTICSGGQFSRRDSAAPSREEGLLGRGLMRSPRQVVLA